MLFNNFKTVRLKKIKRRRIRWAIRIRRRWSNRVIRSNLRYLIECRNLYERVDESSNDINSVITRYKIAYDEWGNTILIVQFIKSGKPADDNLVKLKDPLETIFNCECSEPYKERTYVEYHIILEEHIEEDSSYLGTIIGN